MSTAASASWSVALPGRSAHLDHLHAVAGGVGAQRRARRVRCSRARHEPGAARSRAWRGSRRRPRRAGPRTRTFETGSPVSSETARFEPEDHRSPVRRPPWHAGPERTGATEHGSCKTQGRGAGAEEGGPHAHGGQAGRRRQPRTSARGRSRRADHRPVLAGPDVGEQSSLLAFAPMAEHRAGIHRIDAASTRSRPCTWRTSKPSTSLGSDSFTFTIQPPPYRVLVDLLGAVGACASFTSMISSESGAKTSETALTDSTSA